MMDKDMELLHQKIDYLTEQFEAQQRQREALEELKKDLIPITNHMIKLSIDELEEIGTDFELEDLLYLLKRFLRSTHLWMDLLDRLETIMDLADEASVLGKQAFANTVETLDQLEQEGYFAFARGGYYVLQRIVSEFSEEDVRAMGDNIVDILTLVQNLTQPKVLALANNAIKSMHDPATANGKPPSTLSLLRQLSDPKVRIGLSKMLTIVSSLADESTMKIKNGQKITANIYEKEIATHD